MSRTIRRARPGEAALLTALALRSKAVWGYDADFMARCRAELTTTEADIRDWPIFVCAEGKRFLGFGGLRFEGDRAEIEDLFVMPEEIGRGVGQALARRLIAAARAHGATRLGVTSDPFAEGFYRRIGFTRTGERPSGSIPGRMLPYLVMTIEAGGQGRSLRA